jgi:hypothetical protein
MSRVLCLHALPAKDCHPTVFESQPLIVAAKFLGLVQ